MKCKSIYSIALAALLALGVSSGMVGADPVVVGDPSKGTPITTVKDGKTNVTITTTGISVEDGEKDEAGGLKVKLSPDSVKVSSVMNDLEDILIPAMFFMFLVAVILGGRYFASRNEQRRLEVLRLMVEKGQPVPESVVQKILSSNAEPEADGARQAYNRTRNAYAFSLAGLALLGYALIKGDFSNTAVLVPGLIFFCLGAGGIAGLYLPKQSAGKTTN